MTASTTDDTIETPDVPMKWRGRRPAPQANAFFRFGFPVLVAGAALIVFFLWKDGAKAVLDTTDGEQIDVVDDPAEPGFLAFATPTPTLTVAHVDADDVLVGVTVLARTSLDDGGSLVVFSPDMLISTDSGDAVLHDLYAEAGVDGIEAVIAEFMQFGFTDDPMVMEPERLALFFKPLNTIPFFLTDDLVTIDADGAEEVVYESGFAQFGYEDLAEIYEWRNPTERDDGRFTRQLAIWEAWLAAIGEIDDEAELYAATLPFDEGLPPYLRALATGAADLELVPAVPVDYDVERPFYTLANGQASWPIDKGREMVPLPASFAAGAWPTVQLLDGTGNAQNRGDFLPVVVAAGAEITVVGNALSFDIAETQVAYHDAVDEEAATDLAAVLGVAVRFEEDLDQPAEVTVTVGVDFADVMARLLG